jgi:hypothetical protein
MAQVAISPIPWVCPQSDIPPNPLAARQEMADTWYVD